MAKKCDKGEKRDGDGDCRNYTREYAKFHGKAEQIHNRSMRNSARRESGCGKGMEADHRKPLSRGGTNARSNVRCVSRAENRRKGAKYG